MKLRFLGAVAVLLMGTSLAQAAWDANAAAQALLDAGYTRVEIKIGATTAKLEAIKDGIKLEVTYDLATGDILKSETDALEAGDDTTPGVFIDTEDSVVSEEEDDEDETSSGPSTNDEEEVEDEDEDEDEDETQSGPGPSSDDDEDEDEDGPEEEDD